MGAYHATTNAGDGIDCYPFVTIKRPPPLRAFEWNTLYVQFLFPCLQSTTTSI